MLIDWLAKLLGVVCNAMGLSPEELEAAIQRRPIAFLFCLVLALVALFDVFLPMLVFPFKVLSREAEARALRREEAECGLEARATAPTRRTGAHKRSE